MRCRSGSFRAPLQLASGLALMLGVLEKSCGSEFVEFDRSVLEARGLDPRIAEHLRSAPRFQAGRQDVALLVNGAPMGQVPATFDDDGQLCLDSTLLERAEIKVPAEFPESADSVGCLRAIDGLAGAQVRLDPGQQQIMLLVPTDTLIDSAPVQRSWTKGGLAGLLNYDALIVGSSAQGQSSQYRNLGTEWGFNAGDWVVRSRQSYTSFQNEERLETLYTQASRTWDRYQANVQLGQLNLRTSLFAGEAFTGFQIHPDTALARLGGNDSGSASAVDGVAYSPSRIEVRQSGVVVYTTLVPAGPFTLRDLPLLSHQLDLDINVHEENGEQRQFRVPAASLRPVSVGGMPGYGFAAGKVRRFASDDRPAPSFFVATQDWQWWPQTLFSLGVMGAEHYQSLGWGVQQALAPSSAVRLQHLMSYTPRSGQGAQLQAALSTRLGAGLSVSLTASQQNTDFRTLADMGQDDFSDEPYGRASRQWGISLSRDDPMWGAVNGTLSRYISVEQAARSRFGIAWSRLFDRTHLSLDLQREYGGSTANRRGTSVYATLSLPLGRQRSVSAFSRHDDLLGLRTGTRYREQISETLGYSIAAERRDNGQTGINGRLSALPRYTSVDVGYSRSYAGATSHDLALRGGVAVHEDGLTPSPYPLRDTFALLSAGDVGGIKLSTPQGPVWTDGAGRAVAASLPAYQTSRIEIDTISLPRNVELQNGFQEVEAGRGAVARLNFRLSTARRLMLQVRTVDGAWAEKGASVYDDQGQYLTSVVDTGLVYLADAPSEVRLQLMLSQGRRCRVELNSSEPPASTALYETAEALCRMI